jgi:hypothetical protein
MSYYPDPSLKTVKIPVKIKNGLIEFYFEGPLPEIENGTLGDLIVPSYSVKNPKLKKLLSEERKIPLLKKDTILFVHVQVQADGKHIFRIGAIPDEGALKEDLNFVPISLEETLYLYLRGTKHPTLCDVKCKAIHEEDLRAKSLNHIYTLISEKYEKNRISHTGNVFKKIFYEDEIKMSLFPIDRFRHNREILFDNRFVNDAT